MVKGLNRRDSAARPMGTFPEIWPGCFGWRARLWGVFRQIAEIGQVWGREIAGYAEFFRRDRTRCVAVICAFRARQRHFGQSAIVTGQADPRRPIVTGQADPRRPTRS